MVVLNARDAAKQAALLRLGPHLPVPDGEAAGWTGRAALPGGGFPADGFEAALAAWGERSISGTAHGTPIAPRLR